jgi:hypothetical protein
MTSRRDLNSETESVAMMEGKHAEESTTSNVRLLERPYEGI